MTADAGKARRGGTPIGRRGLLLGLGACVALGDARLAFGEAVGEARLVVILLRGGLDGLAAVAPYGDPDYAALRGPHAIPEPDQEGGALDLGGTFGLHPRLQALHALYGAGEALVLHAVAGPYRTRSHFDAQTLLEGGGTEAMASGWLNRALAALPGSGRGAQGRHGLAVGLDVPLLMRGPAEVGNYVPATATGPEPDLLARIAELHAGDPVLGPAIANGLQERGYQMAILGETVRAPVRPQPGRPGPGSFPALAAVAGRLLAAADGPRVAALEAGGWDTHAQQGQRLLGPLGALDDGITALRGALGEHWRRTAVLVMTEFGRTARINGTAGTDHGTGGVAFLLGGAVAGGRVQTDWPGLSDNRLFQGRDLQPSTDLRSVAKALLRDHLQLSPAAVAQAFPDSGGAPPLGGLLRA